MSRDAVGKITGGHKDENINLIALIPQHLNYFILPNYTAEDYINTPMF